MLVAIPTAMPGRAVDEQVRQLGRQDRRLLLGAVVVVDEVDGVLVDVGEHLAGDRGQARLGVAHRGGGVAVDRAEVALAVDERVAHREVLGEPDEGVVQRAVAVRVVLAHHLADDRRALAVRAGRGQPHLAHRVEDPAVDRLEAVADVGQGARHDDAHRVVEVADPHLVLDADRSDSRPGRRSRSDLSCRVRRHGCVAGSSERGLGMAGGVRQAGRSGRRSRRRPRSPGRPARLRIPASRSRSSSAVAGSSLASVSRMTQARWPSSVAGGALGLVAEGRLGRRRDRRRSATGRPTTRAFWTSGSASPMSCAEQRQGVDGDLRVAAAAPVDVGHRRDGRADEPALPAGRAVDELLQLGPAIGLGGDALGVRVRQRIDGDPVAGLAGGAAQELPGPLGLGVERPLEEAEGEPARLELRLVEEAIGDEQERRRRGRRASRCGTRAGRRPAAASGRRGPRRSRARRAAGRRGTSGSARAARPRVSAAAKPSGSLVKSARAAPSASAGVAMGGHERDGVGGGLAPGRGRRSRGRPSTGRAGRTRLSRPRPSPALGRAECVAIAEGALRSASAAT